MALLKLQLFVVVVVITLVSVEALAPSVNCQSKMLSPFAPNVTCPAGIGCDVGTGFCYCPKGTIGRNCSTYVPVSKEMYQDDFYPSQRTFSNLFPMTFVKVPIRCGRTMFSIGTGNVAMSYLVRGSAAYGVDIAHSAVEPATASLELTRVQLHVVVVNDDSVSPPVSWAVQKQDVNLQLSARLEDTFRSSDQFVSETTFVIQPFVSSAKIADATSIGESLAKLGNDNVGTTFACVDWAYAYIYVEALIPLTLVQTSEFLLESGNVVGFTYPFGIIHVNLWVGVALVDWISFLFSVIAVMILFTLVFIVYQVRQGRRYSCVRWIFSSNFFSFMCIFVPWYRRNPRVAKFLAKSSLSTKSYHEVERIPVNEIHFIDGTFSLQKSLQFATTRVVIGPIQHWSYPPLRNPDFYRNLLENVKLEFISTQRMNEAVLVLEKEEDSHFGVKYDRDKRYIMIDCPSKELALRVLATLLTFAKTRCPIIPMHEIDLLEKKYGTLSPSAVVSITEDDMYRFQTRFGFLNAVDAEVSCSSELCDMNPLCETQTDPRKRTSSSSGKIIEMTAMRRTASTLSQCSPVSKSHTSSQVMMQRKPQLALEAQVSVQNFDPRKEPSLRNGELIWSAVGAGFYQDFYAPGGVILSKEDVRRTLPKNMPKLFAAFFEALMQYPVPPELSLRLLFKIFFKRIWINVRTGLRLSPVVFLFQAIVIPIIKAILVCFQTVFGILLIWNSLKLFRSIAGFDLFFDTPAVELPDIRQSLSPLFGIFYTVAEWLDVSLSFDLPLASYSDQSLCGGSRVSLQVFVAIPLLIVVYIIPKKNIFLFVSMRFRFLLSALPFCGKATVKHSATVSDGLLSFLTAVVQVAYFTIGRIVIGIFQTKVTCSSSDYWISWIIWVTIWLISPVIGKNILDLYAGKSPQGPREHPFDIWCTSQKICCKFLRAIHNPTARRAEKLHDFLVTHAGVVDEHQVELATAQELTSHPRDSPLDPHHSVMCTFCYCPQFLVTRVASYAVFLCMWFIRFYIILFMDLLFAFCRLTAVSLSIWTKNIARSFDLVEKALIFDFDQDDEDLGRADVIVSTGRVAGLVWLLIPGFGVIAKACEILNAEAVIVNPRFEVTPQDQIMRRFIRWLIRLALVMSMVSVVLTGSMAAAVATFVSLFLMQIAELLEELYNMDGVADDLIKERSNAV